MRFHLEHTRMNISKRPKSNKCWRGCWEKGFLHTVSGNINQLSCKEKQCGGSSKIKINPPGTSTTGHIVKGNYISTLKKCLCNHWYLSFQQENLEQFIKIVTTCHFMLRYKGISNLLAVNKSLTDWYLRIRASPSTTICCKGLKTRPHNALASFLYSQHA